MTSSAHPILDASTLPYGLPNFAEICDADIEPAIRAALDDHSAEIAGITAIEEPATVENTVIAMERSGAALGRALSIFYGLLGPDATLERLAIDRVVSPLLAAHHSEITLNPTLFDRVDAVLRDLDSGTITADDETARLVRRHHRDLLRAGAALDSDGKGRLAEIDSKLAVLTTAFGENLLASTTELAVHVTDERELTGLGEGVLKSLAAAASTEGKSGWLIHLGLPTVQPIVAALESAQLRAKILEASVRRGATEGHDNTDLVLEIVRLRAERAELLGYLNHAAYVLEIETAGSVESARGLLTDVADAAATNARNEAKDLLGGDEGQISPADWAYLTEKLRADRYSADEEAIRPYFELERVLWDGVFHSASQLYGLRFVERDDLVGYHPEVRVIEVLDEQNTEKDSGLGLLLLDYFARPTKRGGAWMSSFVDQSRLLSTRPVVVNVMNLTAPAPGDPVLLTMDEVTTMYHECGHALHGLLSDVCYPIFSGTSVPRDFVEFPSQVNEMWARDDAVLSHSARHYLTDESISTDLVARMREAEKFGEGQATVEYLAAAVIDLAWHCLSSEQAASITDIDAFESSVLAEAGLDVPGVLPRYRSRYFQHIFAGGYSAAYYSYLWAEVLDADAAEWITEQGGLQRASGEALRREVLSRGGATDFLEAYRRLRGAPASPESLLRRRGLVSSVVRTAGEG